MHLIKLVAKDRNYFCIGNDNTKTVGTIIHSDTLFSALCNNLRKIHGKEVLEDILMLMKSNSNEDVPNLRLTSAFHYVDILEGETWKATLYFVPKPFMRLPLDKKSQKFLEANPKVFKKIKFVSLGIINLLQRNQPIKLSAVHIFAGEYLVSSEEVELLGLKKYLELQEPNNQELLAIHRKIQFHEVIEEQKVGIDRKTGESKPFTWEKLSFLTPSYHVFEGSQRRHYSLIPGFYFLLDLSKLPPEMSLKIKTAISLMKDEGIGGRRSTGSGLFDEVEFKQLDDVDSLNHIFESSESNLFMNISLVYPNHVDLKNLKYFNLFNRSGYVFSSVSKSQRFQDVTFLEEGSIFAQKIRGSLVQVASGEFQEKFHDVFKNGIGFYLNLGKSEGG